MSQGYALNVSGVIVVEIEASPLPGTPGPSKSTDLKGGWWELHPQGPVVAASDIAEVFRGFSADYDLPRVFFWAGGIFAVATLQGAAITATITPVLWPGQRP